MLTGKARRRQVTTSAYQSDGKKHALSVEGACPASLGRHGQGHPHTQWLVLSCFAGVTLLPVASFAAQPGTPGAPVPRNSTNDSRLTGPKRFTFDAGFTSVPPGLRFTFSRPVPTLDLSKGAGANPVAVLPDQPRYERFTALAGAPGFELVRATPTAFTQLLGSGLDHDGVTPLMVVLEDPAGTQASSYLDVLYVADAALMALESTGNGPGRIRTLLPPTGDLMRGTIPGKQYRPQAATVAHGLIVVFCTVSQEAVPGEGFVDSASAFIVSQDRGATWSLSYESPAFFPGVRRGAPWAMQNWWPMKRGVPPTTAYFAAADYCLNPGSPGGNSFVFRATRPKPGRPWVVEPARIMYQSFGFNHHHIAGVLPFRPSGGGSEGLRVFSVLGDSRASNRIVSLTRNDTNYLDPNGWFVQEDYHGAAASGEFSGAEGNQFVGCAPGPHEQTVLAGSDLTTEQLMLLEMDNSAPSHPRTKRLFGSITADGDGNLNFIIRTPTPEHGGPYVATHSLATAADPPPLSSRVLISYDGEHWAQAAAPGGGYPCIHGGHIYFDGATGVGIQRSALPPVHVARPLLIGPGGWQRQRADARLSSGSGRMVALTRSPSGEWLDEGVPIFPQPPSFGPVYKISTPVEPAATLGFVYPASSGVQFGPQVWPQIKSRWWIMNPDRDHTSTITVGLGFTGSAPVSYRESLVVSNDMWAPIDLIFYSTPTEGAEPYMLFRPSRSTADAQTLYVALDSYAEGRGYVGYPMPPDVAPVVQPPGHAGTEHPDELAAITGFACGPEWTITLAMQFPEEGVDFTVPEQRRWSLATCWGDAQNFVELVADMAGGRILAEVTAAGARSSVVTSAPLYLTRGSPILVSLAHRGFDGRLEMTLSAAGQAINTHFVTLPPTGRLRMMPREVRYYQPGAPASSSGILSRVTPMQVWGGQIDDRTYLSDAVRRDLIKSLDFIAPKK